MKQRRLTKQKYLNDEEYDQLERRIRSHLLVPSTRRNAIIIFTAMHTGARAQEILNIRKMDLDPKARTVFIRGLKGSNDREIPLPDWLYLLLEEMAKLRTPRQVIFDITYQRLYQIWESLKTCPKKFHALRHTFAVRHLRRTNNLRLIQIALGHAQIQSTMVYASYLMEKDELRKLLLPVVA